MTKKTNWLDNFVEKNAWGIIIALVGLISLYTMQGAKIQAAEDKIRTIEQAQFAIIENQKSIIELQTNQTNIAQDIAEIKKDVNTLLLRK